VTLPDERAMAVLRTEQFLLDLCTPSVTKGIPSHIRDVARSLLRHYPHRYDLETVQMHWTDSKVQCPFELKEPYNE
jgi:hypothetical protein